MDAGGAGLLWTLSSPSSARESTRSGGRWFDHPELLTSRDGCTPLPRVTDLTQDNEPAHSCGQRRIQPSTAVPPAPRQLLQIPPGSGGTVIPFSRTPLSSLGGWSVPRCHEITSCSMPTKGMRERDGKAQSPRSNSSMSLFFLFLQHQLLLMCTSTPSSQGSGRALGCCTPQFL